MRVALVVAMVVACSPQVAPKTPESMRIARLAEGLKSCPVMCVTGYPMWDANTPPPSQEWLHLWGWTHLPDCCTDELGDTWSACAWNARGQYLTRAQLLDPTRLAGNCVDDSPAWPDCRGRR